MLPGPMALTRMSCGASASAMHLHAQPRDACQTICALRYSLAHSLVGSGSHTMLQPAHLSIKKNEDISQDHCEVLGLRVWQT